MADFSTQATDVAGPQAAGANPIAPVQEQLPASGWDQAFQTLGGEIGRYAGDVYKRQQQTADAQFLGGIAKQTDLINQGLTQGVLQPVEADTRLRTLYSQSLASRADLAGKINGLFGAFKSSTATGTAEDAIKDQQDIRKAQLNQAVTQGYYIPPNATSQQQDAIIRASQSGVLLQRQTAEMYKRNDEARAQGNYDRTVADAKDKDDTATLVTQVASDNLNAFRTQIDSIQADASLNPQQKLQRLADVNAHYQTTLSAIAARNPSIAAPFKETFDKMNTAAQQYMDPTKDAADAKAQLDVLKTQDQLNLLLKNPNLRPVVAASTLLGNNLGIQAFTTSEAARAVAQGLSTPVTNGQKSGYTTPIVGNPEAEGQTLDFLKKSIRSIDSGAFKTDEGKARIEAANGINNVLVETGNLLNSGADPKSLSGLASFFSSPEYASMVKNGKIDPQAQQAAAKTFQITYQPAVTQALGVRLGQNLVNGSEDGTQAPISLAQGLNVEMRNGVLTFVPNPSVDAKLTPEQKNYEAQTIQNVQDVQGALNQMVHLGAHMEGTTDYAAHWEKNKYYYLPQVYPVKPGQIVGNLKWSGDGDWRDKNTWSRVGQR